MHNANLTHSANPFAALASLRAHRVLFMQFVQRSVAQRYKGSVLGLFWSLVNPLLMLAVYSFVFVYVFQARWGADTGPKGEFAVMLFSGLMLHGFLAECLSRAPTTILDNRNFVKKVIFPLELLPSIVVASALFQLLVSFGVLLVAILLVYHTLPPTLVYLPIILLPFVMLCMGASWFLASLGVYVRDTAQIMGILVAVLMFLSTIFYPADKLPPELGQLLYLNPLSFIVDEFRRAAILRQQPHWEGLGIYYAIAVTIFTLGFAWFQKTRKGFADVI